MSIIDLRNKKPVKYSEKKREDGKEREKSSGIVWQIPEYEYRPKDVSWYWISLIAAIILFAFAIWQENFLFAIFVAIAFFAVNYLTNRFPPIWEVKMNERGIFIGLPNNKNKKFYPIESIEGFDIHSEIYEDDKEPEYKKLVLRFQSKMTPYLKINIYSKDESKIKDFLLEFAPQEEISKSLVDSLSELIGF